MSILYVFFDIIVINYLKSLLLYGIILRFMRQFGDSFSIVITIGCAVLISHNPPQMIVTIITAYAASMCTIKTNTFYPAFVAGVISRFVGFIIMLAASDVTSTYLTASSILLVQGVIIATAALTTYFFITKRDVFRSHYKDTSGLPEGYKINRFILTIPTLFAVVLAIVIIIEKSLSGNLV